MTLLACVVTGCAAVAWLGWCWVLVQREDVEARMRLADAVRQAEQHRATVQDVGEAVGRLRTDLGTVTVRLEDAERRLQSTIARVGMR